MNKFSLALIKKDFFPAGGLEKVTHRILDALLGKEIEVTVYTACTPLHKDLVALPCPTFSYQPKGLLKFHKLYDFDQWVSQATASHAVVFSMDRCSCQTHHRAGNGVHAAYLDLRAQWEGPLSRLSFALNPLHQLQLRLEKRTFESPHTQVIIVNSELVRSQILTHYKTPSSKIHVIHNGVEWKELEIDFIDSLKERKKYATRLNLDPSVYQFLFVGHNFKRKGLDILLNALPLLKNRNFHLSIVGHDKKIEYYKRMTCSLGMESQVTFFGTQLNPRPFFLASDALVIPSLYDPFANVTVEALALGLFVVSSSTNGGHEVLHSYSGITTENPLNHEELADALDKAMAYPKEGAQATAIRQSVSHLDYPVQLDKICGLCRG